MSTMKRLLILGVNAIVLLHCILNLRREIANERFVVFLQIKNNTATGDTLGTNHPRNKNLVVFNAIGQRKTVPVVEYNVMAHFQHGWDCIIFTFLRERKIKEEDLASTNSTCTLVRLPETYWTEFLMTLTPELIRQYEHVAIVLDDLFAPRLGDSPVHVPRLLQQMQDHNLSSISPAVRGAFWNTTKPRSVSPSCLYEVNHIETFFQIFTADLFLCFRSHLRYSNRVASCMDMCLGKMCPHHTWGVDASMVAYHLGKEPNITDFVPELAMLDAPGIKEQGVRWNRGNPGSEEPWWWLCEKFQCPRTSEGFKPDRPVSCAGPR